MKVIGLEIENIKAIKAVTIHPAVCGPVIIGGANGAGKTATLDAIAMALGGEKLVPKEPIRHGEDHGRVAVDLGE